MSNFYFSIERLCPKNECLCFISNADVLFLLFVVVVVDVVIVVVVIGNVVSSKLPIL